MRTEISVSILFCGILFLAQEHAYGSDFGNLGLIKVPTARMPADGELRATLSRDQVVDIYNISYQATPWLETTFRYSIFNPRDFEYSKDGLRDRSYEAKARVHQETNRSPELAIGVRDLFGTGVWEGEYLVASKLIGQLDFTVGLGWGRLASRNAFDNPLRAIDSGFAMRPSRRSSGGRLGGKARGKSYFRGEAAPFGGVRFKLQNTPLHLIAEYNSDDYDREVALNTLNKSSPWNFGIEWRPNNSLVIATSWQHGSAVGLRFSSSLDTKSMPERKSERTFFSSMESRAKSRAPESLNLDEWYDRLLYDAERSGLRLNRASTNDKVDRVILEIENSEYAITADAIHKALALSEIHLPYRFQTIELSLKEENRTAPTIQYRRQLTRSKNSDSRRSRSTSLRSSKNLIEILPPKDISLPGKQTAYQYPFFSFGADLATRMQLMDPNAPLTKQLYAKFSARVSISPALNLWTVYGQNIYNDFTTERTSDSLIQKVRSDVNKYLTSGESGFDQIFLEYKGSLGGALHFRSYAGLLESMYAGIGTEILYERFGSRWAVGATINGVKQRAFEKNLRLLDYQTVTSFLSLYYASPFYNFDFAIHGGRYLARDKGMTFEARRTFDNGFSLGGFFTRTNVPAELFGEGSFDKGLYFRIPFNGLFPGNTKNAYAAIIRPLERDGGRRLEDFSGSLWFSRRNVRYDSLAGNKSRMIP